MLPVSYTHLDVYKRQDRQGAGDTAGIGDITGVRNTTGIGDAVRDRDAVGVRNTVRIRDTEGSGNTGKPVNSGEARITADGTAELADSGNGRGGTCFIFCWLDIVPTGKEGKI